MSKQWKKTDHKLPEKHGWRVSEGYQLCVMGRGMLQFEFPADWHVEPKETSIKVANKKPPADDYNLEASVVQYPHKDWDKETLATLLQDSFLKGGNLVHTEDMHYYERPDMQIVWGEYTFTDSLEPREVTGRTAFCYKEGHYGFITLSFWTGLEEYANELWEHTLATIDMGRRYADPAKGPLLN